MEINLNTPVAALNVGQLMEIIRSNSSTSPTTEKKDPRKYGKAHEISQLTGLKQNTIYFYVRTGQMPHIRKNGRVYFDIDETLKWLESFKVEPIEG